MHTDRRLWLLNLAISSRNIGTNKVLQERLQSIWDVLTKEAHTLCNFVFWKKGQSPLQTLADLTVPLIIKA